MPDEPNRVTVSTYVPPAQRERWRADADALDMSQSEFVRSMVQAGCRGFSFGGESTRVEEPGPAGSNPRGDGLETTILDRLREEGPLGWAGLVEAVTGDLERDLEASILELQETGRIQHSPRTGAYSLAEDADG